MSMIKRLLQKIRFDVEIKLTQGYENNIGLCQQYPLKHLMHEYDIRAKKTREEINCRENKSNVKFHRYHRLKRRKIV